MKVQLISPLPDRGFAFNEGAYWPVGLLTIGTALRRSIPDLEVEILDESLIGPASLGARLGADVVGIQASSNLTYQRVVELARRAKSEFNALVVLGGPYASLMAEQILANRSFVDAVVTGPGEMPMVGLVKAARKVNWPVAEAIPGVLWRHGDGVTNPTVVEPWSYETVRPLDYSLIPVARYHDNYRERLGRGYQGAFQIFTHFGCRYRDLRRGAGANWCTYCALGERLVVRDPQAIRSEIEEALVATGITKGARLMLKCYGDNASALGEHLFALAGVLSDSAFLRQFDLAWSVYAQSCYVTPRLVDTLAKLGVAEVYVGFDSADDGIQRLNGLGTSRSTHVRASRLLKDAGIRIQAGFVLGCEGESPESLATTMRFCEELRSLGNIDLFHASPLVVLAGSGAFQRLSVEMPEILATDYVDPDELQREWLRRFCPALGTGENGQRTVSEVADSIAALGRIQSDFGGAAERPTAVPSISVSG